MEVLDIGNSAHTCDVTELHFHWFCTQIFTIFHIFIKYKFSPCLLFNYDMAKIIKHDFLKELSQFLKHPFRKMKSTENLFTKPMEVELCSITDIGGVAISRIPIVDHYTDLVKL